MSANPEKRKSLCANTGRDSLQNLPHTLSNNPLVSIPLIGPALVFRGWLREAIRLARLVASTGETRHAQALVRHLEAVASRAGAIFGGWL